MALPLLTCLIISQGNQGNLVQKDTKGFPAEMETRDLGESKAKKDKTGSLG